MKNTNNTKLIQLIFFLGFFALVFTGKAKAACDESTCPVYESCTLNCNMFSSCPMGLGSCVNTAWYCQCYTEGYDTVCEDRLCTPECPAGWTTTQPSGPYTSCSVTCSTGYCGNTITCYQAIAPTKTPTPTVGSSPTPSPTPTTGPSPTPQPPTNTPTPAPPTNTPTPFITGVEYCDFGCGTCGKRLIDGSCGSENTCCHRVCSGCNCLTVWDETLGYQETNWCNPPACCTPTPTPTNTPTPTPTCGPPACPTCAAPKNTTLSSGDVTFNWGTISTWNDACLVTKNRTYQVYQIDAATYSSNPDSLWGSALDLPVPHPTDTLSVTGLSDNQYVWGVLANNSLFSSNSASCPVCPYTVQYARSAWWQTKDGDVHAFDSIVSLISDLAADPYLSLEGDNSGNVGVVSWRNNLSLNDQLVSDPQWQAKTTYRSEIDFSYLVNRLNTDTSSQSTCSDNDNCTIPPTGVYYYNGNNLTFKARAIGAAEKVIILVENGSVTIKADGAIDDLTVGSGGFLAIATNQNLTFASDLMTAEGFFLADGTMTVQDSTTDSLAGQFKGRGSFIAHGGIDMARDIGGEASRTNPSEYFDHPRWDLYLSAPKEFLFTPSVFKELAP